MSSSGFLQKYQRGRREAPRLPEYRPLKPLGRSRVRRVPGKTPTRAQELRVPGGRAPRGARMRAGAKPTGHCSPDSPGRRRAQGVHLPTCLRRVQSSPARLGRVRSMGVVGVDGLRRRGGPRAARAPQERAEASRPPLGPHCIRGKKLRGDVPLLPALPAPAGCHRDIASPLHGALLSRPTCPPTATEYPSKRANDLCLPEPDNNKRLPGPAPRV